MLTSLWLKIFEIFFSRIAIQGSVKYLTIKSFFKNQNLEFGVLMLFYVNCDLYYFGLNTVVIHVLII